jgi:hypothetical protein
MQRFFVGLHAIAKSFWLDSTFISANRLWEGNHVILSEAWVMDSGSFTEVTTYGGYRYDESAYAEVIKRHSNSRGLLAAVAQDYMCEDWVLNKTGLTVAEHQRLTILRYQRLMECDVGGVLIIPVLQGYEPQDYVDHLRAYGNLITPGMWVGVGSVCKRQGDPVYIRRVLDAILHERPDVKLHGFGVKLTSLRVREIADALYSADSMAWSFAARRAGGDPNSIWVARLFEKRVLDAVGLSYGEWLGSLTRRGRDLVAEAEKDNAKAAARRAKNWRWNEIWWRMQAEMETGEGRLAA